MKALLKERPGIGLSLREIDEPQITQADEVKFKVAYCAICVGETKVYDWNGFAANDPTLQLPAVLGHEVSAVVVEVGSAVKQFRPGDRITVDPLIHCGHCFECRAGYTNMCAEREIYGKRRGAFAEFGVLPERTLCKLPDKLSLEEGALLENLGLAVHAVDGIAHEPGEMAVVLGCGPVGIMAAQTLVAVGARVVMTDMITDRLAMAAEISGATVVDITRLDPAQVVRNMTHGRGADVVLETSATPRAFELAFDLVRRVGTVITIGTFDRPVSFNPFFQMARREIKLLSTMGRTWDSWRWMVQMIEADKLNLKPLISEILPLEEFDLGFDLVRAHKVQKVLLKP